MKREEMTHSTMISGRKLLVEFTGIRIQNKTKAKIF